jgi:antitoxin component YwqK of YwqJK toxin-antitoxin module
MHMRPTYSSTILILCCFLFIFISSVPAQTQTKRSVQREYYTGGQIHRVVHTKVTTLKYAEPHNYYKRTVLDVCEYYENGAVKYKQRKIRKIGNTGRPFYELLTDEKNFSKKGILQSRQTSRCDKQEIIHQEYDEQGVLIYKSVTTPW